jgi:hypothetical protein
MRVRFVALVAVALGLVPVTTAWAACLQSHLKGTWRLYVIGRSVNLYTLRCSVTAGSGGTLTGGSCVDDAGDSASVTGGRLRTTDACVVSGTVKVDGDSDPLLRVDHGTLDLDRQTMAGIGRDATGGIFQFTGIKR